MFNSNPALFLRFYLMCASEKCLYSAGLWHEDVITLLLTEQTYKGAQKYLRHSFLLFFSSHSHNNRLLLQYTSQSIDGYSPGYMAEMHAVSDGWVQLLFGKIIDYILKRPATQFHTHHSLESHDYKQHLNCLRCRPCMCVWIFVLGQAFEISVINWVLMPDASITVQRSNWKILVLT